MMNGSFSPLYSYTIIDAGRLLSCHKTEFRPLAVVIQKTREANLQTEMINVRDCTSLYFFFLL